MYHMLILWYYSDGLKKIYSVDDYNMDDFTLEEVKQIAESEKKENRLDGYYITKQDIVFKD